MCKSKELGLALKSIQWVGIALIVAASPLAFMALDNPSECRLAGSSSIMESQGHLPTCGESTTMRALYIITYILVVVVSYFVFVSR
jgi:hypothetical protein